MKRSKILSVLASVQLGAAERVAEVPAAELPQWMRPSIFPSARASWSTDRLESAEARPQCREIISEVHRNDPGSGGSPLVRALRAIVNILDPRVATDPEVRGEFFADDGNVDTPTAPDTSGSKALLDDTLDKELQAAGQIIKISFTTPEVPSRWGLMQRMRHCAVDDKGRTILMKTIEHGFRASLQTLLPMFATSRSDVAELKDKDNNNLMHLAVMTRDNGLVTVVAELLGSTKALEAFQTPNLNMQLPLDLADSASMQTVIKTYYNVLDGFHKKGSSALRPLQRGPHLKYRQAAEDLASMGLSIPTTAEDEDVVLGDNAVLPEIPTTKPRVRRGKPALPVPACGEACEKIVPPAIMPRSGE